MITLRNSGLIEIELITTMGAHVKETENYYGRFGTGLKYAIAVLLREGIDISLFIGLNEYKFYTEMKTIRGKAFDICYMQGPFDSIPLGFTTELGKNWSTWQAYREIYTNAVLDENNGEVWHGEAIEPKEGWTTFHIHDGIETDGVFLRDMNKELIYSSNDVDVYDGESDYLYYQGIRAKDINKPSMYTYNIKSYCTLTEDRCISYDFEISRKLASTIVAMGDTQELMIGRVLNAKEKYFESRIDFSEAANDSKPSQAFATVYNSSPAKRRNNSCESFMKRHLPPEPKSSIDIRAEFIGSLSSLCDDYDVSFREFDTTVEVDLP